MKKLKPWKLREKKYFVNNGTFFFRNSKLHNRMARSINRSNHRRCSIRNGVLRNFANFTGKYLYQSLFFNKVAGFRAATLLKKRLWHRCFPVNLWNFLEHLFYRTPLSDCFWIKKVFQHLIKVSKLLVFVLFSFFIISDMQKQPPEVFCKKICSLKFHKIHRKTPVSESLF